MRQQCDRNNSWPFGLDQRSPRLGRNTRDGASEWPPHTGRAWTLHGLTDRIAVGGGIWTADNMAEVARAGITHIIDMQIEFDDTPLGVEHGIEVLVESDG